MKQLSKTAKEYTQIGAEWTKIGAKYAAQLACFTEYRSEGSYL
jgi:hypothetical protein